MRIEPVPATTVYPLRRRVLRPHQSPDEVMFPGDSDDDSAHFAAFDGDAVVGIVTVHHRPPPWDPDADGWQLRGMATDETVRGRGVGRALVTAVVDHVAGAGGGTLWCNARVPVSGFYADAGFTTRGEPWTQPDIGPHIAMWRQVRPGGSHDPRENPAG